MQVYIENKFGQRFRAVEGWQSPGTIFENDASAELLTSFPPTALDQIFEQFLAHNQQCMVSALSVGETSSLHVAQFPGIPAHFSEEHKAVYTAVRRHQILIEEAPLGEAILEERQSHIRQKIRLSLQKIVAEERIEAAHIQAVHEQRGALEKVGAHLSRGAQGFGDAVWGLAVWAKDLAEVAMVINPIRMQTQVLGATYDYFVHEKRFGESGREYQGEVKKEVVDVLGFDPATITAEQLKQAFEIAHLVCDDAALRGAIGRFAKDYVKAQHSLEISEFAGAGVFEIVLTIVLAAFTGGVGAAAAMAKNARLMFRFKDVGDLMLDFAKYQKQRKRLMKAKGAKNGSPDYSEFESIDPSGARLNPISSTPKSKPRRNSRVPIRQEINLAKSKGRSPEHIAARSKVARHYLESNGFTQNQISDAIGDPLVGSKGGVDLREPVSIVEFPPPDVMHQYVREGGRAGNWLDPIGGQTPDSLGINGEGRNVVSFKVPNGTGLQSVSRPILDTWTNRSNPVQTKGGGTQLFVSDAVKDNLLMLNGH
ncbi:hypothetical protein JF535_15460 [Microbulbifer salipaludis]|uniref:Bacterial toxin 46 domain-containing protein n=1 Tax=Microbulbifer salipaludis TaxID=187980 RepID=A0ABS3EAA9_9GAMM|nr:polymorphic toxin type 46 domain-containing protein [Microbulbifer salipaludis]MBN8432245.1 hypothetical protein [Microbulbifer salipaludis]